MKCTPLRHLWRVLKVWSVLGEENVEADILILVPYAEITHQ